MFFLICFYLTYFSATLLETPKQTHARKLQILSLQPTLTPILLSIHKLKHLIDRSRIKKLKSTSNTKTCIEIPKNRAADRTCNISPATITPIKTWIHNHTRQTISNRFRSNNLIQSSWNNQPHAAKWIPNPAISDPIINLWNIWSIGRGKMIDLPRWEIRYRS